MSSDHISQITTALLEIFPDYSHYINSFINLRQYNLTKTQWKALIVTAHAKTLSMGELAEKLGVSPEQASRTAAPLVKRGFLERKTNLYNQRQIHISLSRDGYDFLQELKKVYNSFISRSVDRLSPKEREEFAEALHTVVRTMKKLLHENSET